MRNDKLAILAIFLLAVAVTVVLQCLPDGDGKADQAGPKPPAKPSDAGEFRGFSMQFHNSSASVPYETFVDEIARTGANTLCLVVSAYQEHGESTSIFVEGRRTPGDERIVALIQRARGHGLRNVFMPIVLLENPREGEWRGKISPTNWNDWWEDYTNYVLHYARLAERAAVDVFMIGSELVSTETPDQTHRWRKLIRSVRQVYKGRLSYSANWDHYDVIEWWDDLDIIGMTSYYDLSAGMKKPTLQSLLAAWKPIKQKVLKWQATVNRPLLFTEVGWPNQSTCAEFPWDYYRATDDPDPQLQADCFKAFFQTWFKEKPVAGYLVWEWRNHPGQTGGPAETGYFPEGKPAMDTIRKYFALPSPWGKPPPPTRAATQTAPATQATRPAPSDPRDED